MDAVKDEVTFLSIDDILSVDDTTYKVMDIPEWKGKIRLGSLSAESVLAFIDADASEKKTAGITLIVQSLVDKNGNRIGKDEHFEKFKTRDMQVINRIVTEVLTLNGMNDEKAAEAVKNDSGGTASGVSPSA